MKILAIIILSLVGTLMLNVPIQSYADSQFDSMINIAIQARNNIKINISQITNVPIEIIKMYKQGSDETDALTKAVNQKNITSAKLHFLSAMKFFKYTNDKINSLNKTQVNDQQETNMIKLQSEIIRLKNSGEQLRTVAIINHANFNSIQFDQLIQKAKQDLDKGKVDDALKSIKILNQSVIDTHNSFVTLAQKTANYRAKDFAEKQIETLNKKEDLSISKNKIIPNKNFEIEQQSKVKNKNPQNILKNNQVKKEK
jgi:hypothetical protein